MKFGPFSIWLKGFRVQGSGFAFLVGGAFKTVFFDGVFFFDPGSLASMH